MQTTATPTTVSQQFLNPLLQLLPACRAARVCLTLPDEQWLPMALARVLHECKSGRAFLQEYGSRLPVCPEVGAFFESLKSKRRLRLAAELNEKLQRQLARRASGQRLTAPVLHDYEVYAGDGHWHGAAVHDPVVKNVKDATGHFYGLNLRTHGVVHLTGADKDARRHEHDMRALKRLDLAALRQNAPAGKKVIWVWDKAGISFEQWHKWKSTAGIYFISCVKENMKLEVIGVRDFDTKDPINAGVVADQLVGTSQGVAVRRVTYEDPVTGERFQFITTEYSLAPGWIAFLYRRRWDIEKVFDEFKNKLSETKSWATSATAKQLQAQLLCLTHNLLLLFEHDVLAPAGVKNQAEDRRRDIRLAAAKKLVKKKSLTWPKLLDLLHRCTQHSVKFIRWLRANFFSPASCSQALASLRLLYAKS
jgi:hypothetical protein